VIHVVTAENRALYEREMREFHRLRHDIYIGERKWQGLRSTDGLEYDDFDTDQATYFVAIEHDRVVGGYPRWSPTGARIAYIFQEPSTSLNPVFTIRNQIAETIKLFRSSCGFRRHDDSCSSPFRDSIG